MMINPKFVHAIKTIHRLLDKEKIHWALIGSTNMQIQGMTVSPRDLDIVVQLKDLDRMNRIFSEFHTSEIRELAPMTDELGWEVKIEIDDVDVQILGERDTGEYVSKLLANKVIPVELNGIRVPCFTLEAEAQTYAETKREHKAKLIRDFLQVNK